MTMTCTKAADVQLEPNELESKLFAFLLGVLNENKRSTILRVAGGWVRDKINCTSSCRGKLAKTLCFLSIPLLISGEHMNFASPILRSLARHHLTAAAQVAR